MKQRHVVGALSAALLAAGAGAAVASRSSSAATVPVRLTEFRLTATKTSVPAGTVRFRVQNAGRAPHELVVLRTNKPAAALGKGSRVPERVNVGETGDLEAGASKTLVLHLARGHYALICNLPGHYMSGMRTNFTVR